MVKSDNLLPSFQNVTTCLFENYCIPLGIIKKIGKGRNMFFILFDKNNEIKHTLSIAEESNKSKFSQL